MHRQLCDCVVQLRDSGLLGHTRLLLIKVFAVVMHRQLSSCTDSGSVGTTRGVRNQERRGWAGKCFALCTAPQRHVRTPTYLQSVTFARGMCPSCRVRRKSNNMWVVFTRAGQRIVSSDSRDEVSSEPVRTLSDLLNPSLSRNLSRFRNVLERPCVHILLSASYYEHHKVDVAQ